MLAQYAPRRLYARLSGIQASLVIAQRHHPTAAAVLHGASGSYTPVFAAVVLCSLGAALLFVAADRAHRQARAPRSPRRHCSSRRPTLGSLRLRSACAVSADAR